MRKIIRVGAIDYNQPLPSEAMSAGCKLLFDSGADTGVAGKHAWVSPALHKDI